MGLPLSVALGHAALTEDFATTAERLRRSTVQVRSGEMGAGSGVIWRADGLIITNAHVVRGKQPSVELWDGRQFDAQVLCADPRRDLAALKISAMAQGVPLAAAPILDSDTLRVGQMVVAVGNPLGLTGALSMGIIHAIAPFGSQGPAGAPPAGRQTWVQADVRLAPGNSGGPLADVLGNVIGINSMVAGGLGLAVPSNAVQRFLRAGGERPRLGVTTQAVSMNDAWGPGHDGRGQPRSPRPQWRGRPAHIQGRQDPPSITPGLLVLAVEEGSPAQTAGLGIGDVLLSSDGGSLASPADLGATLADVGPGGTLFLEVSRGGHLIHLSVLLPAAPPTGGRDAGQTLRLPGAPGAPYSQDAA